MVFKLKTKTPNLQSKRRVTFFKRNTSNGSDTERGTEKKETTKSSVSKKLFRVFSTPKRVKFKEQRQDDSSTMNNTVANTVDITVDSNVNSPRRININGHHHNCTRASSCNNILGNDRYIRSRIPTYSMDMTCDNQDRYLPAGHSYTHTTTLSNDADDNVDTTEVRDDNKMKSVIHDLIVPTFSETVTFEGVSDRYSASNAIEEGSLYQTHSYPQNWSSLQTISASFPEPVTASCLPQPQDQQGRIRYMLNPFFSPDTLENTSTLPTRTEGTETACSTIPTDEDSQTDNDAYMTNTTYTASQYTTGGGTTMSQSRHSKISRDVSNSIGDFESSPSHTSFTLGSLSDNIDDVDYYYDDDEANDVGCLYYVNRKKQEVHETLSKQLSLESSSTMGSGQHLSSSSDCEQQTTCILLPDMTWFQPQKNAKEEEQYVVTGTREPANFMPTGRVDFDKMVTPHDMAYTAEDMNHLLIVEDRRNFTDCTDGTGTDGADTADTDDTADDTNHFLIVEDRRDFTDGTGTDGTDTGVSLNSYENDE